MVPAGTAVVWLVVLVFVAAAIGAVGALIVGGERRHVDMLLNAPTLKLVSSVAPWAPRAFDSTLGFPGEAPTGSTGCQLMACDETLPMEEEDRLFMALQLDILRRAPALRALRRAGVTFWTSDVA